eukprot:Seg2283.5 transcript_id=Seg2283.5/GoldUCD/mRNA.D3Y31 product="hypothetical protein" protein_id=Seg2283.5/GoldUCD/D3Y31
MLDSAAIYCKPRNGKESYYIFDPLKLCDSDEEVTESETDFAQSFELQDIDASTKTTESSPHKSHSSPVIQSSLDSTSGFLDVMGKLADSIKELNQMLSIEKERNESLAANLYSKMEENHDLKHRIQALEAAVNNTPVKNAPTQGKYNREEAPAQEKPSFRTQWGSSVHEKSRQYEQYLISKKVDELKSSNPEGTNKKNENCAETNNKANTESLSTTSRTKESPKIENKSMGRSKSRLKLLLTTTVPKTDTKQTNAQSSNKADNINETHPWRKGTTLIVADSILYGIDERKICQNGLVKVRVFSGTTIEDLKDYYIKPLLRKKPSKVILHVGTNNASLKNANPDQILDALLDFKKDIEDQVPGCMVVLSMPTKRFDNEEYGKIVESLNKKIIDLGIEAINNSNISRGDIGKKGLHLNAKGTSKLTSKLVSKLRSL